MGALTIIPSGPDAVRFILGAFVKGYCSCGGVRAASDYRIYLHGVPTMATRLFPAVGLGPAGLPYGGSSGRDHPDDFQKEKEKNFTRLMAFMGGFDGGGLRECR